MRAAWRGARLAADEVASCARLPATVARNGVRGPPSFPGDYASPDIAKLETREEVSAADPGARLARQNVASTPASGITSARNPSAFSGTIAFTKPIKVSRQRFTRPPIERS